MTTALSVSKNILIAYGSRGCSILLSFLLTPLYLKVIGVEGFAIIGLTISIHAMSYILDLGMGGAITIETATLSARKELPSLWNLFRTGEVLYWAIALLLFGLFLVLSEFIANTWFHNVAHSALQLQRIIPLIGAAIICHWPYTFYSGALLGLQRQDLVNLITLAAALFRAGLSVFLLLWVSPTVEAFLLSYLLSGLLQSLCAAVAMWMLTKEGFYKGRFDVALLKKVGKRAIKISVIGILGILLLNVDKAVLSRYLSLQELGYYCFSWTLVTGLLNLSSLLIMIFGPRFSHFLALDEKKELTFSYHQACQWMSLMIIPASVFIALFSKELLLYWTNDPIVVENAYFACTLLVLGACFNALYQIPQSFQVANHWTSLTVGMQIIALAVCIPLLTFAASTTGLKGAVLVWPAVQLTYFAIYIYRMHKKLLTEEKAKWLRQDILKPALGALLTCGLCRLVLAPFIHGAGGVVLLIAIAILTMSAAALMSEIIRIEIKKMLKNILTAVS